MKYEIFFFGTLGVPPPARMRASAGSRVAGLSVLRYASHQPLRGCPYTRSRCTTLNTKKQKAAYSHGFAVMAAFLCLYKDAMYGRGAMHGVFTLDT
jgi:hypothetical protein